MGHAGNNGGVTIRTGKQNNDLAAPNLRIEGARRMHLAILMATWTRHSLKVMSRRSV
ncbi:MAG: hypothetical protein P4L33_00710 [Capsulimonadaceae bacterium]|nr:hypothetical protein [Capsulimonadaceae bacterium]